MRNVIFAGIAALLVGVAIPAPASAELENFVEDLSQYNLFDFEAFWYDCSERSGAEPRITWSYVPADRMHSLFNLGYVPDDLGSYWRRGQGRTIECLPRLDTIDGEFWGYAMGRAMTALASRLGDGVRPVDASIMSMAAFGPLTSNEVGTVTPYIRTALVIQMVWPDGHVENRFLHVNVYSDWSGYTSQ